MTSTQFLFLSFWYATIALLTGGKGMEKLYNGRGLSAGERLFVLYKYFLGHKNRDGIITYKDIQTFLLDQWEMTR